MSKAKNSYREHSAVESTNASEVVDEGIHPLSPLDADDVAAGLEEAEEDRKLPTSELTEGEREAFIACEREGIAPSEFANLPDVDVSASTVRTQLSRARSKVKEARE